MLIPIYLISASRMHREQVEKMDRPLNQDLSVDENEIYLLGSLLKPESNNKLYVLSNINYAEEIFPCVFKFSKALRTQVNSNVIRFFMVAVVDNLLDAFNIRCKAEIYVVYIKVVRYVDIWR
jgi:hypothetical protein